MKRFSFIKNFRIAGLVLTTCFALLSFTIVSGDVWQMLGISREKGSINIKESFIHGYLHYYGVKNPGNISINNRQAITNELLPISKELVNTEGFIREYEKLRNAALPAEPIIKQFTKESIRKERIAETEKAIKETELNISKSTADMAKALQPLVEMLKKNLEDYKNPDSEMIEMMYQGEKMNQAATYNNYQQRYNQWIKDYPKDHKAFIKKRLEKFIVLAKTVDFNAPLKQVNNKKKFVNPAYEAKGEDWKQIYRAGKEVIVPALEFAEQWMKELE